MDREARIIDYLEGTMSVDEKTNFEREVAGDPSLASLLQEFQSAQELTRAHGRIEAKKKLQAHEQSQYSAIRRSLRRRQLLAVAASIALLAVAFVLLKQAPATPDDLYVEYFETYREPAIPRGDNDATIRQAAFAAYAAGDYQLSAATFEQLGNLSDVDRFYQGLNYLIMERPAVAVANLTVVTQGASDYRTQATWYLALGYLKMNDLENARLLLNQVIASGIYKVDEAAALLEDLD